MVSSLRFWPRVIGGALALSYCVTACRREDAPPAGAVVATISPGGSVTATAADGRAYAAVPDAQTGTFAFPALPAGLYTLSFAQKAPYRTPGTVAVTVVAGTTTTPVLVPISHDGVVRGNLRWTVRDTTYTANVLNDQLSSHSVLLSGLYAPALAGPNPYAQARELSFALTEVWHQQAIFHGVGTYPLGTQDYPWAQYNEVVQLHWTV